MTDRMKKMVDGSLPDGTLIRACEGTFDYLEKQDDRIEKLEKYQSIHAQCDKVSLELEAKLAKQLGVAHKRIEKLEAALREIAAVDGIPAGTDKDMYRRWRRVATNAIDIARKALDAE